MTPPAKSLKESVVTGVGWSVLSQGIFVITRFGVGVVLAHLLSPRDYGLAGMAFVFSNLLATFNDLAMGVALIQRPEITEADRSTVFWTTLAVGIICTLAGVGASGLVADFFHQPKVGALFALLSVSFTLTALAATQTSLLTRELAYRSLQIREIGAVVGGAVVAVVLAEAGFGPWAIVSQTLAYAAISVVLLWTLSSWHPRLLFSLASLRNIGGFGIKVFGSQMLAYVNLNADNLLIGRFLGGQQLGAYSLAFNVMFTPILRFALPLGRVVFPAYARIQTDPERLGAAWVRSKRLSAAVLSPVFFVMMVAAPDLVPVVFGAKWHNAIPVLQLLGLTGVAHTLVTLNWAVLQAQGKAGLLLRFNLFHTTIVLIAFAIGLRGGIVGVAAGYAIARWALVPLDNWIVARSVSMPTFASLRVSATAIPLGAAAALIAFGVRQALLSAGVVAPVRLLLVLAVAPLAYLALVRVAAPSLVREVRGLRRNRSLEAAAPSAAEGAA